MNTPRPRFALLLLAASLTVTGCQKQTAAAVRRGIDLPVPVVISSQAGHGAHRSLAGEHARSKLNGNRARLIM